MINKHTEEQYLELETNFLNLFNAVESLLTITEGEDLNSDSQRLSHFNALCERVTSITERFSKIKQGVLNNMFPKSSINHKPKPLVSLNENETKKLFECVEHYICMFERENQVSDYKNLLKKIKEQ